MMGTLRRLFGRDTSNINPQSRLTAVEVVVGRLDAGMVDFHERLHVLEVRVDGALNAAYVNYDPIVNQLSEVRAQISGLKRITAHLGDITSTAPRTKRAPWLYVYVLDNGKTSVPMPADQDVYLLDGSTRKVANLQPGDQTYIGDYHDKSSHGRVYSLRRHDEEDGS